MRSSRGQKPAHERVRTRALSPARAAAQSCPRHARFCPACGQPVDEASSTVREPVPSDETGRVPVHVPRRRSRTGSALRRRTCSLGVAVVALVLAIVLFATGHWPFGADPARSRRTPLAAFFEAARRRPSTGLRAAPRCRRVSARTSTLETWRARSFAANEAKRIRALARAARAGRAARCSSISARRPRRRCRRRKRRSAARLVELDAQEADLRRAARSGRSPRRGRGFGRPDFRYRRP